MGRQPRRPATALALQLPVGDHAGRAVRKHPRSATNATGFTEQPMLRPRATGQSPGHVSQDNYQVEYADYDDPHHVWRDMLMEQITPESLEECSESGHPRQAWLILSFRQDEATSCPVCGRVPEFWEKMSGDERVLTCDYISEILNETHMASHEVFIIDDDDDDITFVFQTDVFQDAEEWPKVGSINLTRLPYPGDDAITLRWFRDEWNERGYLPEDIGLLNPHTKRAVHTRV